MQPKVRARRNLAAEAFRVEIEREILAADHRIGEIDFDLGAEAGGVRPQFAERVADRNLHRLQHLDEAAACGLLDNAGLIDRGDERRGAAVHDRHFGTIDFDGGVVDAHSPQRSKNVFRGGNQRTVLITEHGGEFGGDHGFRSRLHFAIGAIETGADKNITGIDRCRSNGQIDSHVGMNADARHGGFRRKRGLTVEFHSQTAHY